MREIRTSGSEGGVRFKPSSLPLSSLSPAGEGENSPNRISRIEPMNAAFAQRRTSILPLPAGEGRGEGVSGLRGSGGGARSGKLVSGRKELAALFPKAPDAVRAPKYRVQMAKAKNRQPGVVLDYVILSSQANVTFSNVTFYINGTVSLSGTTVLYGGAVLKFNNSTASSLAVASGDYGTLTFLATNFHPVIFCAKDDDTIGDQII